MRTYKDIEVKYYDTKGDVHVRCSVPVTEDALVHFELMQSHYCKLSFKLGSAIYFKMGDFIVTDYGRFELVDNVKPKDDGNLGYSYELEFDAYYRKWKNKRLKYMPNSGSPEGTFTLTSNIITHANIIKDNLDFLAKASKSYLYDPNYTGKGSDYTFVVDASVDSTKSKVITYSNSSILDAIANIAQTFECEWWVEGNLVHFGTCENTNEVVDFKDGENIVSMSSSQSQASYANRVYAFGAARNLPSGYKQNSSADVTKNGVVEKRLMLPTLEECSAENKKLLEDNGFELKNGCLQVKGLTEDEYVEGVTTNDDIYPRNLIKTSNVTYYEKDVEDESTPEEGDYIKRTFYRVKGLTIVDADGNKTGDMAFRSSYILSGKTLHIIFQSGSLNGMDFECQFNPDGESEILRDSNGSPILKDGKEQINPAAQVFEIVANEDYGRFLPDTVLHPKDGDTFVLYNWDSTKLGNTLVTSSANELLTDAIKNLKKSMIDPTTYTCTAASDYSYNDGKGQFHFEGDRVNLFNKGYDMSFRASRIIGYELHLDVPFDSVKYTVGEKPAYSRLNAMSSQIEELVFNGQSYLNKGGSGNSIYIIKSYDTTVQPTDFNVFSAKRVENSYLHKDKTDAANFLIKFLRGLQVGDYSALSGGDWSLDELFRSHLTTDYLNVRMKAIFETLEILHTDTLGGELFITTVGSNRILKVEEVNITYDGVSQKAYRCYFLGEQDGSKVENKWKVGDQARSKSFNLTAGKYHNVGNHYYWRLVIGVSSEAVEIDGKKYHYVDLSDIDKDAASDEPMVDDILNQCGNRTDITRQSCLVFSAVDTYSPCITLYHGVDGYTFNNKEYVNYGVNHSTNKAFFHVYGDMYVGDRPTKENGYEGSSYIRYDSSTKQLSVKGKISAKSTVDGKGLSQYIKENTDDTVANAAKKAAEDAQKAAQTAQTDITNLGKTVTDNKKEFDNYVTDGYLEPSEIAAMAQDSKRLEDDFEAAQKSYNEVKDAEVLKDTKELTDLNTAFATLTSAKTELIKLLSDISKRYNETDTDGKAAIVSAVGMKFTNFQSAYSAFYDKLGLANAYITRKIYGDLKQNITDLAGYKYLKDALGQTTDIDGGLVMTTLLALRDGDGNVQSGINGAIDPNRGKKSIATWWGGQMVDKDYNSGNLTPATSLIRFDGSGYLANGAIWWDVSGKVHADPTSFIISEKNLGAYLIFFEPTWKEGSAGTSVADLVSLKPNAPFSKLGVSGDATFEGAISFHGIKLTYDSTNKAIKIDGNLYATGGITAYGAGASTTGGGGGLIASVISYARILEGSYTDADLTSIPNAYAIKALSSRIDNIATELGGLNLSWNNITGKPSTFAPSAHTHKWTEITDRITKVSQLTNDAGYLTAHQSLASYYTKAEIDAKGYTTNKGTVTSVALTLPTGLACATKTITASGTFAVTFASGYSIPTTTKQTAWDGAVSAKHTHSNKSVLDGISSAKVTHWNSAYDWYALMTTDEETADGIINKWNEVVSFLANIAQTDTLSGIVDGINKSISDEVTRAKKAEGVNASGISTNKTNITTLQGYFTSGSAKKALQLTNARKLWGNSFNGTSDVNGSIIVPNGKYISIGNIKMEYDATNKALKITNTTTNEVANLYTSGGVSAYGVGTSSSSGGGLNGSVKSYADALKLTSESLSEIASAYSIKALDSRISSLEGGSATAISVSGSGNAVTSVTKDGTTISVVKGSTFLTSHQSLDGYVNAISVSGSGNAITSVSKSGKGITFTKGSTFLTSHQSLSAYLKSADAANTYLKLSGGAMTGNIRYKGSKSTCDMITFVDNNADTYGNGICIGGCGLTIIGGGESANTVLSQHTSGRDEYMIVANDAAIYFFSNLQNGWNSRKAGSFDTSGYWNGAGFKKDNSSDSYVLLGGGGHKAISSLSVNYASSAGSASSVAWSNVSGRPTKVSQFTNDNGYITSSGSCAYATSAGNADKLDGIHANGLLTALSNSNNGISITVGGTTKSVSNISVNYASSAGNADTVDGYHATSGRTFDGNINWSPNWKDSWSDGTNTHPWYGFDHRYERTGAYSTTITDYFGMTIKTANTLRLDFGTLLLNGTDIHNINVASASKLATARSIWGQSFDGTGNVNGTIYINNSDSSNGAIRLNSDISSNARISAIYDQVIFNTGNAIRFGETAWDWNQWAGLKYTHSNKTIYLGIADNSAFNANNAQSNGTLILAGITTITPNSGARIGNSGADLYLGNASNSAWVKVQDICSQTNSSLWSIRQDGNAYFKSIYSGAATIYGNLSVTGLISNKGILPTNYEFNNKGTSCYVSADALCSGITAITDSIQVNQVTVQYSNDSGNSWTNYSMNNDAKFNLYASNAGLTRVYLGYNVITGNNDAEKLAQVIKNELIVSFYISNSCYAQPYFASVDISNGIDTICTVEILNNSGAVVETYTKHMAGWNQVNYISLLHNGNTGYGVGNNDRRYIRFKFKHDQKTTALRNTVINKIRIFSFTKYSFPTDRFMGHTGHIYNFDYNMNTYFPNSILAKGGVTAYQSSDIRLKQDLRKLDYLGIIKAMGGTFGFAWKKDNTRSIGWIAQHVLCNPHLKDIVETDEKGYYKINYWSPKLIATAFGAIEQVGDEVSRLKARVVFLESEVQRLSGDKDGNNKKRLDNKNINSLN